MTRKIAFAVVSPQGKIVAFRTTWRDAVDAAETIKGTVRTGWRRRNLFTEMK